MGGMEDLSGEAIITAHRLLKNGVGQPRYILVTDSTKPFVHLPAALAQRTITETLDSAGEISATAYGMPDRMQDTDEVFDTPGPLPAKVRDFVRKVRIAV